MEFDAKVVQVLPPVTGKSARGEWRKQDVVVEKPGGTFNKKVCVTFWGDKVDESSRLKEGEEINVSIDLESREYNGRWYTEVRAWKMNRKEPVNVAPMTGDLPPFSVSAEEEPFGTTSNDDLPF